MLRLAWDNGDRSVLADPRRKGVTLGWRLHHSAADELLAAIEGTGFHTRIILDRIEAHGVAIKRVINAGGIPQRSPALNRTYASILDKPVLVPSADTTALGSAIFAFLAAGEFATIEAAQEALGPGYVVYEPEPAPLPATPSFSARSSGSITTRIGSSFSKPSSRRTSPET